MIYRFLIVDDEYYVRKRVKRCIDWKAQGFECVGEAATVQQALDLLEDYPVELVIADISMPGINGLSLIKTMYERNRRIKVIVLSGFSTFEYAKEAMRYGVIDYLLKPIDTVELIKTLQKIRGLLDKEQTVLQRKREYRQAVEFEERMRRARFFQNVFDETYDRENGHMLSEYGLSPDQMYFLLLLDVPLASMDAPGYVSRNDQRVILANSAAGFLQRYGNKIHCADKGERQVFLCEYGSRRESVESIHRRMMEELPASLNMPLCSGYSQPFFGRCENIAAAYRQALHFFWMRCIYGSDIDVNKIKKPSCAIYGTLNILHGQIQHFLSMGDASNLSAALKSLFSIMQEGLFAVQALEIELGTLFSIAIQYATTHGIELFQSENDRYSCLEILHSGCTLEIIRDSVMLLYENLLAIQTSGTSSFAQKIVCSASEMIQANFQRPDIGLKELASALHVSPSYLSRSFTKITGVSITHYITRCRLECAREKMLAEKGVSLSRIAEEVGYRDVFYFSRLYKRHFKVAPSQHRAALQGNTGAESSE